MTCRRFADEAFLEWGEGETPRPGFEAHLAGCAGCRDRAGRFRARVAALRGLARLEPPPELWDLVAARRARPAAAPVRPVAPLWLRAACFAGIAASVAISAGLAVDPSRRPGPPPGVVVVDAGPTPEALIYAADEDEETVFAVQPAAWRGGR